MLFPNYPPASYEQPAQGLLEGYINFLGRHEKDHRHEIERFSPHHLRRIAMRIGRGCLIAANNNALAARRFFTRARRDLSPVLVDPARRVSRVGREAIQLNHLASMLENRENPVTFDRRRRNMHRETVQDVKNISAMLRDDWANMSPRIRGDLRGQLAQKVTLGLLTRYAHPWMTAMPALVHHDRGKKRQENYDVLLVESMPSQEAASLYKLQVKCECLGLCADRPQNNPAKAEYNNDIAFVSACCDLQRGDDRDTSLRDFRAADLLVREAGREATPDEVRELDSYTDSLLLSVTMGDERRMGAIGA